MKSFSNYTALTCFVAVTALCLFSACMPEPLEQPSRVQVGVQLNDLDSVQVSGSDSLQVNMVRLIYGYSFFVLSGDSTLLFPVRPTQLTFPTQFGRNTVGLFRSRFPERVYEGIKFRIERAEAVPDSVPRFNPDNVFTDGGNYAMVIDGLFNGKDFTLKIPKAFTYKFTFTQPVTVSSEAKNYTFLISANIESWFNKATGTGYINPTDGKNKEAIIANIEQSFTIEQLSP